MIGTAGNVVFSSLLFYLKLIDAMKCIYFALEHWNVWDKLRTWLSNHMHVTYIQAGEVPWVQNRTSIFYIAYCVPLTIKYFINFELFRLLADKHHIGLRIHTYLTEKSFEFIRLKGESADWDYRQRVVDSMHSTLNIRKLVLSSRLPLRRFRDTCPSVKKVRLAVRHAQRRVHTNDVVNNMAAHSILFMHHLYVRPLICLNSIGYIIVT